MFLNDSYFFTLPVSLPRYHFSLMNEQSMDGGGQINQSDIYYFNSSKHSLFFHLCQTILIITDNFSIKIRMLVIQFHPLSLKNSF